MFFDHHMQVATEMQLRNVGYVYVCTCMTVNNVVHVHWFTKVMHA